MTSSAVSIQATDGGMVDSLLGSEDIIGSVESLTLKQCKPEKICVMCFTRDTPKIIYRY